MTCIRGNNLPKCECLKMRTPSIFKSLLNPLLEGFFNPTTNQPTNPPTNPRPSQPTSISHLILYICNILGRCWLFRQVCFRLIARKVCLRKWGIMSFTFGKKTGVNIWHRREKNQFSWIHYCFAGGSEETIIITLWLFNIAMEAMDHL